MKTYITLILLILSGCLCSITRTVALDGSQQYTSIQAAVNHINSAYKNGLEVDNDLIGEPGYKFGQILTKYFNGEATPVQKEFLQIYS